MGEITIRQPQGSPGQKRTECSTMKDFALPVALKRLLLGVHYFCWKDGKRNSRDAYSQLVRE